MRDLRIIGGFGGVAGFGARTIGAGRARGSVLTAIGIVSAAGGNPTWAAGLPAFATGQSNIAGDQGGLIDVDQSGVPVNYRPAASWVDRPQAPARPERFTLTLAGGGTRIVTVRVAGNWQFTGATLGLPDNEIGASGVGFNPVNSAQYTIPAGHTVALVGVRVGESVYSFAARRPGAAAGADFDWVQIDGNADGAAFKVDANGRIQVRVTQNGPSPYSLPIWTEQRFTLIPVVSIEGGDATTYEVDAIVFDITGTGPGAAALPVRIPAWASIRAAIPNDDSKITRAIWARNGQQNVSENYTKLGFTADGPLDGAGKLQFDFTEFDQQAAHVDALLGAPAAWDLHGPVWHKSLTAELLADLAANPSKAKTHLDDILAANYAHREWVALDVNEVARSVNDADGDNWDFWRGPINTLDGKPGLGAANGSTWYEAFAKAEVAAPGYWPHGPGYWWLYVIQWAKANGKRVAIQDFDMGGGRIMGPDGSLPSGLVNKNAYVKKARRLIEGCVYAAAHNLCPDVFSFQAHVRSNDALDERNLHQICAAAETLGMEVEINEFDIAPYAVAGGSDGDAAAQAHAAHYTRRLIVSMTRVSISFRHVGLWTGFTDPATGDPERLTAVDNQGVTPVGDAIVAGLSQATPPVDRTFGSAFIRYVTHDRPTQDVWRAVANAANPGFSPGGATGSAPASSSGGARLPLVNAPSPTPGDPVAAVWWNGAAFEDFPRRDQTIEAQFTYVAAGDMLRLREAGATLLRVHVAGTDLMATDGATSVTVVSGLTANVHFRVAISWLDNAVEVRAARAGGPVGAAAFTITGAPDDAVVLGDGAVTGTSRLVHLDRRPHAVDAATLAALAGPQSSHMASVAEMAADANFFTPPAISAAGPVIELPDGSLLADAAGDAIRLETAG